jgi:hypothetical protein
MRDTKASILWTDANGIRCVLAPYDESRYQLKLMRHGGTIRADLFSDYADALAASRDWKRRLVVVDDHSA